MKNLLINRALAAETKKLFILLFALVAGAGTLFASDTQVNGIWYDFDSSSKSATVTYRGSSYSAYSGEYTGLVAIPASVTYNNVKYSVTSIGSRAFQNCTGLTYVTIPNSVTYIGSWAFCGCSSLTYAEIPNSVTRIGTDAFSGCSSLTAVPLPNSLTDIGDGAFMDCTSLTSVTIPNSITRIWNYVFQNCTSLTSVTIPNSITRIERNAFFNCFSLTSVTIPSSVTSIGIDAFKYVPNIVYSGSASGSPWGAKSVNGYVDGYLVYSDATKTTLKACSASAQGQIVIPNSVTSIGYEAFRYCTDLTSVTIPNSVTSIGAYAFRNCTGLTFVTIGNSVTSIGAEAFGGCTGLLSMVCEATTPPTLTLSNSNHTVWYNVSCSKVRLYVPANSVSQYKSADQWKAFNVQPISYYTITWKNWDGTTLKTEQIVIGMTPTYTGTTPTRPATAEYTYKFKGWNPAVAAATANQTYTATFTQTLRKYTITWKNADGTTLKTEQVDYGTTPSYTGSTPTKVSTAQYTYTFSGWTPTIAKVTANATYTATFTQTLRKYTITWKNADGTTLKTEQVEYGITPSYTGSTPTKESTAQYDYTFAGWTPTIAKVTANATYTATFTQTLRKYTITWKNADGTTLKTEQVEYGITPSYTGSTPTKASTAQYTYTFSGWTPTIAKVTANATYTATFTQTLRKYTITWKNADGTTLKTEQVDYGTTPSYTGSTPTKASTAQYTYTFSGWTPTIAKVTANATYTATFTQTLRKYTITWKNADGTTLKTEQVDYGTTPSYTGSTPTKASTAQYDYTFAGWTPEVTIVTQATTYTATYTSTLREYLVTFLNDDNTVISSKNYKYGETPVAPSDPIKQNTAEYTYSFNGWDNAIAQVQGPQTYKATYTATKNSYTITWQNEDGSLIDQTIVEYGQVPAHADPIKQNTAEYTYTFAGWTPAVVAVTGDATYIATFTATKNSYTITWQDENGSLIDQTTVEYGQIPAHADPIKQNTAEYTYTFAGWTPAVVAVTSDATYKATFTATKNSYTITWQNEDGSLIDQTTVEYGVVPTHAEPTKEATEEYTYTFAGWTPAVVAVTGNATYQATFTATKNSYTITWQNEDGSLIDQTIVEYGIIPTHADPVKLNTAEYTYTFAGWTPAVVAVTGDATYKATFLATKNNYTITWLDEDGSLIDQTTIEYGVVPTHSEPTKEATVEYSYIFAGWTPVVVAVTGDATYTAKYNSVVNIYTITVIAINGQVLGAGECQYGATIDLTAIPDEGYVFDQWSDGVKDNPRTITVTGDAEYTALFTSTEDVDNIYTSEPVQKVMIDQKVYILRGEKVYTLTGQEVK